MFYTDACLHLNQIEYIEYIQNLKEAQPKLLLVDNNNTTCLVQQASL